MNSEDVLLGMLVGVRWGARQAGLGGRIGTVSKGLARCWAFFSAREVAPRGWQLPKTH